ncbi:MAG TPA: 23S rRNA pseudouridine(2604) synthase RluF [Clostridia bacterium]|nr:23S rRNA pseudouridine(2604) synthase RluF [Clostridia bacterium]
MKDRTDKNSDKNDSIRINKYISEKGLCSRREADELIRQGQVTINGKKAEMGSKVYPGDIVKLEGKALKPKEPPVYLAFNKPAGIVCTTDQRERDNIIDFIGFPKRIFPVGRLDKESEGLIFLTSDGDIVNKILRAGNNHEKEYIVTVDKPITEGFIESMAKGVRILGTVTKKCKVLQISRFVFRIILTEGMNRQIRRMCEVFGYEVVKLKRVRIMNVALGSLPAGKWRHLTSQELKTINRLVAASVKTEEASR